MTARPILRTTGLLSGALLAAAALVGPAQAQDADARWLPWLGCWEPVGAAAEGAPAEDALLCVRQAGGGVEVVTLVDGEIAGRETLRADGTRHESDREGCRGWSQADFSYDARRVYVGSEHRCEGETTRRATGLIAMTSPHEWIEVESIEVGGRNVAWVRRYRAADAESTEAAGFGNVLAGRGMAVESARMAAASPIGVEDIIEASARVHAEAVEAWVADTNDPLDLDARTLLTMADAGVPERVIDVAVAVSYPEHFAVDRRAEPRDRAEYSDYYGHRPRGWFGYGSWYDRYSMNRYGYGYGSPWGYGGWSYGYRPSIVVVQPRASTPSHGRVIAGKGYRRGGSGGSNPPASVGSSRGGSGGSAAPSSGSSGGRKAKPRGGPPPTDGGSGGI